MVDKSQYIDIEIDKLTNSLENVISGDRYSNDIEINDPKDIDFYVDQRPLIAKEQKMISDYIKADKQNK